MPLKILLVDDEEDILWGLSEELSRHGWEILTASSGTEALQILQSTKDLDFLITDVRMPDISGIDLLLKARELQPQIRAIVMTAHGNEELKNEAFQRGAISYLEKPFDFDQLLTVIQEMEEEGAAGTLQEWNLMDVLQLVAMEGRSARFTVQTPEGPGVLWVKDGELWYAEIGPHQGEEAFFHILRHENVQFQMDWVDTVDVDRNIQQPLYALLLEVVRMRNEARTEDLGRLESELLGSVEAPEEEEHEELPSLDEISLEGLGEEPEEEVIEIPEEAPETISPEPEEEPASIGEISVDEVMEEEHEELPSLDEISLEGLGEEPEEEVIEIPEETAEVEEVPEAISLPEEAEETTVVEIPEEELEEILGEEQESGGTEREGEEVRVIREVEELQRASEREEPTELTPDLQEEIQEILEEDRRAEETRIEIEEAPPYEVQEETPEAPAAEPEAASPAPSPPAPSPPAGEKPGPTAPPPEQLGKVQDLMKRFAKATGVTGIHVLVDTSGRVVTGAIKGERLREVFSRWIQTTLALAADGDFGAVEDFALTLERFHLLGARVGDWVYVAMLPRAGVNIGMARVRFQNAVKEMRKILS